MERLKGKVVDLLARKVQPEVIYEKSDAPTRAEEGLTPQEGVLQGGECCPVVVRENRLCFLVDPRQGQKTGFYLDQRGMRDLARSLAQGRSVLNCFSYTGGFSVATIAGKASRVVSVDTSEQATRIAKENFALNGLDVSGHEFVVDDVFGFLRDSKEQFDFIILDPPAFAKKKADVVPACRGYKDINRLALERLNKGGLLMTSSCSYYVDEKLFQQVVFEAAAEVGRPACIIQKHHHAFDHPVNVFHPESSYLKSLLLCVG